MSKAVIKSVRRVFEVLELFDDRREALTATQINCTLNYPQASALVLLKSLVELGYLSFDKTDRTYFPNVRTAMLGRWIIDTYYGDKNLETLPDKLSQTTGETAALCSQNDLNLHIINLAVGPSLITLNINLGLLLPIFGSVAGSVALSDKTDEEIEKLAARMNSEIKGESKKVDLDQTMQRVRRIRRNGYGVGYNVFAEGVGTIACILPPRLQGCSMVLDVTGPSQRIKSAEKNIVRKLKSVVRNYAKNRQSTVLAP